MVRQGSSHEWSDDAACNLATGLEVIQKDLRSDAPEGPSVTAEGPTSNGMFNSYKRCDLNAVQAYFSSGTMSPMTMFTICRIPKEAELKNCQYVKWARISPPPPMP